MQLNVAAKIVCILSPSQNVVNVDAVVVFSPKVCYQALCDQAPLLNTLLEQLLVHLLTSPAAVIDL